MMPIMNGLDLLKQVKERDPDQLVIIMTGYADKEIILRALKADADDFIQKPLNLLQLKSAVEKALEKRQLRQELQQLKRLDRLKAEFLGLISHKLRTPTTVLSLLHPESGQRRGGHRHARNFPRPSPPCATRPTTSRT